MIYSKESGPFALIIFGGSGDLSYQKIYPALYDIAEKGHLPEDYAIIATGRKYTQEEFYNFFEHSLTSDNRHHKHSVENAIFKSLEKHMYFYQGDNTDPNFYTGLSKYLDKLVKEGLPCGNRLFYAGVPQSLYQTVFANIKKSRLNKSPCGWARVVIEKPIGEDEASAKKLDKIITSTFTEDQIFRLDHYLGKETLENVLVFRFKNNIFEPMLNGNNLDHIQITSSEDFSIAKRGKFYNATGALKDVGQNHILQMLAIATMEQPKDDSDEAMIGERIKLVKSLTANPKDIVYGQYAAGVVHGKDAIAYRQEASVPKDSQTDTFFAMKVNVNNERFKNVPVYIRAGKQMAMWLTEISYVFKGKDPYRNVLTIRVQPNEGIAVKLFTKKPGLEIKVEPTYMQFCYKHYFPGEAFDAYEKLVQDVFAGRHTFFNISKEVEAQWRFIDSLSKNRTPTRFYKAGSWGPKEAFALIEKDGRKWLEPYPAFCQI
ncbi:MAG: glucose-6-phosphate dehydrogenase [Candidatus Levybacteria bacterium RIFCSPLOWO2_01_FULL_39_24]|nr:MAG: glucose-6-phosphate dehydrogenase [Candidatus Levybacteria bacterium RIFCSPHIGHO2_01_FULL_40_16]OGH28219.1 MAG: glucose-6-phosphate dehydrogenase [Candidatus Levybacteria bacterium RIFCSPHIGHO2_12_FULL_39_9]OGH46654.1 MAG: glucose-6-phosphate dehydrogenase [Candidatus Levybacteria bacterium RIFCSPLOWO2_01_FULL_39_24]